MRTRRKVVAWTLAGLLITSLAVLVYTRPRTVDKQPVYRGRTLAQWLSICRVNGNASPQQIDEAKAAVRAIGTNALPSLLAWISFEPSNAKIFYRGVVDLLPLPEHPVKNFLSVTLVGYKHEALSELAVQGFAILNTNAVPALEELTKLANDNNHPLKQIKARRARLSVIPPPVPWFPEPWFPSKFRL